MKMNKSTGAVLLVLCAAMAVPARADDASRRAKVQELFTLTHVNRMTEQITSVVRKQLEASVRGLPGLAQATPEQKKLLADYETKVMNLVDTNVNWTVVEPQMVELYESTYTEAEIDGILAFYKSPVGQTMLAKSPDLTRKSMEITQGKLAPLQPQITELSQEFSRQYAAAQSAPPKPGTGSQGAAAPK